MAVDTAAKRASALNAFSVGLLLPIPDGTIGDGDRAHLLNLYSGIAGGAPVEGTGAIFCAASSRPNLTVEAGTRQDLWTAAATRKHINVTVGTRS